MRIDIGTHIGEGGFTLSQLALAIQANADDNQIDLYVTSPGGDVAEAESIYAALLNYKKKDKRVRAFLSGTVASAATYMVMAADEIIAHPDLQFMIHNAWITVQGNKEELQATVDFLEGIDKGIASIYLTRTKASQEVIAEMMKAETWLTAQKALELGFIDSIDAELKAVNADRKAYAYYQKPSINLNMDILEQMQKGMAKLTARIGRLQASINNMEVTLADGTVVFVESEDGEFVGKAAYIVGEDGEMTTAPDGTHDLEDGRKIITEGGIITAVEEAVENALKAENEQLKSELAKALEAIEGLSAKVDALAKKTPAGGKPTAGAASAPRNSVSKPQGTAQKTFSIKELAAKTMGRSEAEIEQMINLKGNKK
jgi:ATP-dependent protease ClpP protease subunit